MAHINNPAHFQIRHGLGFLSPWVHGESRTGSSSKRPYCEVSLQPGNPKRRRQVDIELNGDPVADEGCPVQFPDVVLDGTMSLAHPEVVCVSDDDDNDDDPGSHERFSPEPIERGCCRDYIFVTAGPSKSDSHTASLVDKEPALFLEYGFLGHKEPLLGVLSDDAWDSEFLGQEVSPETEDKAAENLLLGDPVQDQNVVCISDDEDGEDCGGAAPETERCSRSSNPLYQAQVVRTFPPGCGSRAPRMPEIEPWGIDLQDDYFSDDEDENVAYNIDDEDREDTGAPETERCSRSTNTPRRARVVRTFPVGCGSHAPRMPDIEPLEIELQDDDYFSDDGWVNFSDDSCSDFSDDDYSEISSDDDDKANN